MEINKVYCGDVMDLMAQLPDKSINCVITSPPYWQLRDYGFDGQWGLEPTYQDYLEHLWEFMGEVWRVLTDDGTVWVNLGDTYNSSGSSQNEGGFQGKQFEKDKNRKASSIISDKAISNLPIKCLLLIPHRFAIGCIDRGWILRNDIIWAKPNSMPESVTDRFSKKHEYFFFMVKQQKYYFDLDAIKDKIKHNVRNIKFGGNKRDGNTGGIYSGNNYDSNELNGKNPGDVSDFWDITTKGSSESHYASYNTKLIEKPIVAGCPEFICKKCGKAREKIFNRIDRKYKIKNDCSTGQFSKSHHSELIDYEYKGLTDCGCNAGFEGGIILDPFCGTGTTLARAYELGRNFIGFDGKQEYIDITNKNLKSILTQYSLFK